MSCLHRTMGSKDNDYTSEDICSGLLKSKPNITSITSTSICDLQKEQGSNARCPIHFGVAFLDRLFTATIVRVYGYFVILVAR